MLKQEDAERALDVLSREGMRREAARRLAVQGVGRRRARRSDLRPTGFPITDEVIERGEDLEVVSTPMRVMRLEDVFVAKLLALDEQNLDYKSLLEMARPVREQVDWEEVRDRTAESPTR